MKVPVPVKLPDPEVAQFKVEVPVAVAALTVNVFPCHQVASGPAFTFGEGVMFITLISVACPLHGAVP